LKVNIVENQSSVVIKMRLTSLPDADSLCLFRLGFSSSG